MKCFLVFFALAFIVNIKVGLGQEAVTYIAHATLSGQPRNFTLTDTASGTKYILDSTRIFISAVNRAGKVLWKTDPWKDNKLPEYRVERPVIARFHIEEYYYGDTIIYANKLKGKAAREISHHKKKYTREVIWIAYENTQFGVIDKSTGKFTWFGQD